MTAEVRRRAEIGADPDAIWAVLADFGALSAWAADIDHSCLLHDGPLDVGQVRRVQVGRTTLLETVDVVEPDRRLGYRITGLPPVLRTVRNEWALEGAGPRTAVSITTTVDAGPRPPQRLVARLVAARLGRTSDSMLAGLARHLTAGGTSVA